MVKIQITDNILIGVLHDREVKKVLDGAEFMSEEERVKLATSLRGKNGISVARMITKFLSECEGIAGGVYVEQAFPKLMIFSSARLFKQEKHGDFEESE